MSALEVKKPKPAVMGFVAPMINDDAGCSLIRSMRITDKMQDLMDFYYAMVPAIPRGRGVFLYQGKRVDGDETPADYNMCNNGICQIEFLSEMKPDMFVTLTMHDREKRRAACTMRRTDKMQFLMDFYNSTVSCTPKSGCFWYDGKRVEMWHTSPAFFHMNDGALIKFRSELKAGMLLTLTVVDSQMRRIARTIRKTDGLQILMDLYYATVPIVEYDGGMFAFDGRLIKGSQTPMDLDMEDGDVIDFFFLLRSG
ncbi:hypothetical protein PR202_ga29439 [Eleusine coracana subsp. coracana]|uniref:Ubiquitin-like domain-containing protein n=1 Tax=Eleusine coracana subsp. coracana TaxID=191504 RepID=A0AAV5DM13_ELECO|nr:hypothetical protein QOZ80_7AG0574070 [Eleusine coracana subsp. coracana]GJN11261.1 hypothetical protein PR202_ga29439 [Eleusine coracana subsp. coracana]